MAFMETSSGSNLALVTAYLPFEEQDRPYEAFRGLVQTRVIFNWGALILMENVGQLLILLFNMGCIQT